jgi:hypothetical protein
MIVILDPSERKQLVQDFFKLHPLPTQIDFIQVFTGIPNLTRLWNQYALKASVVEKVLAKR